LIFLSLYWCLEIWHGHLHAKIKAIVRFCNGIGTYIAFSQSRKVWARRTRLYPFSHHPKPTLRDSTKTCNTPLRNFEICHWVAKQFSRAISISSYTRKTMTAMYHGSAADPGIGRCVDASSLFRFCLFFWQPFPVLSRCEAAPLNPAMESAEACRRKPVGFLFGPGRAR